MSQYQLNLILSSAASYGASARSLPVAIANRVDYGFAIKEPVAFPRGGLN